MPDRIQPYPERQMNDVGDVGIRETLAPTLLPFALFSGVPLRLPVWREGTTSKSAPGGAKHTQNAPDSMCVNPLFIDYKAVRGCLC